MSSPELPNITPTISLSPEQNFSMLLASIALEELALAQSFYDEVEKLQQLVLGTPTTDSIPHLLALDLSVQRTLRDVIKKHMLLELKFEDILDSIAITPLP